MTRGDRRGSEQRARHRREHRASRRRRFRLELRRFGRTLAFLLLLIPARLGAQSPFSAPCGPDTRGWTPDPLPSHWSPVDLSFLNDKPAGRHGFVEARGEDLAFEDGTPVRFWGVNLQAGALFRTSPDQISVHARRIAELGFNLVRLHHHDSIAWVRPAVIDHRLPHTQALNPAAMAKLDLWIAELKRHGVYLWLDLHTGRVFKEGDEVPGFVELARGKKSGEGKGFAYLNTRLQELMEAFNTAFLGHVNRYTGIAYKDDPAIAVVMITNENDVTTHFRSVFRARDNLHHRELYAKGVRSFAEEVGLSAKRILAGRDRIGTMLWLNEIEHRFNVRMRRHLASLGFRGLVTTTSLWGGAQFQSLPSLADGDLIDVHSYGLPNALRVDPRKQAHFIARVAGGQLLGRPVSVSEWNLGRRFAELRHTAPLHMAAIASLQAWDAPILFGYANRAIGSPGKPSPWASYGDPALMGIMPAAAVLFRMGHVSPARYRYVLEADRREVYRGSLGAGNTQAMRTLVEQSRVALRLPDVPELPWSKSEKMPAGVRVITDLERSFLPPGPEHTSVTSDTGELRRDWAAPLFVVDTARSQVVSGVFGPAPVALSHMRLETETEQGTLALTSLDGLPLPTSTRILLTAMGRACPEPGTNGGFRAQPILGTLRLERATAQPLTLKRLASGGGRLEKRLTPTAGSVEIPLGTQGAPWYLLTSAAADSL